MAQAADFRGDVLIRGTLTATSVNYPAGTIRDAGVASDAAIAATKLEHQFPLHYCQAPGAAIVAATQDIHIVQGSTGEVVSLQAAITGALADDVSRVVTVQLHKSTGAGAFASILTTPITFGNTDALRTMEAAVINTTTLVAGDILRLVITVAGGSGNQAQGLAVTLFLREDAA